jgi:hypothetical protein
VSRRTAIGRLVLIAIAFALALAVAPPDADAASEAYLRVIAQSASVHTGPGASYREIYVAERGEVFTVLERGTRGYWFKVKLEDGTTGWIFGELVFPFEVVDSDNPGVFRRMGRWFRRTFLGPSPVPYTDVQVSFSAGILDREGLFLVRPAWLLDGHFALEAFVGLSPRAQTDIYLAGLGWTLRMAPGAAIGPYVNAGVGAAHITPKADNFTDDEQTLMVVAAGGGFEITFKKQITLRLDFRNWTLFDPDEASNGQEYTGGLSIFF